MNPKDLKTREPFEGLFPIDPAMLATITASMKADGFDEAQPIVVWQGTVIDGHTRLAAAIAAGIVDVPIARKRLVDEDKALAYAIHNQRDRRNMTSADMLRCIAIVDRRKAAGERTDLASSDARSPDGKPRPKSSAETAAIVGTSPATVERARTILDSGDAELRKAVDDGKMSIAGAAAAVKEKRMAEKPILGKKHAEGTLPKRLPPCDGNLYAHRAIDELEKIKPNDVLRKPGFDMVSKWIKENK